MSSKSVLKKGDVGLEAPAPKRMKRNTSNIENSRTGSSPLSRKKAGGLGSDAERPKPTKRAKNAGTKAGDAGELIGRRVGHGSANLKRAMGEKRRVERLVDTSEPGVAADDKKAGGKHTAARNTKLNANDKPYMLEDSATGVPSRKSTRRGANHIKHATQQTSAKKRAVRSPEARAAKSIARGTKVRGGSKRAAMR